MSPAVKNGLYIGALVIAIGAVVWYYTNRSKAKDIPDDDATATAWMCDDPKCGWTGKLTDYERVEVWMKEPGRVRTAENMPPGADPYMKQTVFKCPKCGKYSVVRARIDKQTGEWYFTQNSRGERLPPREPPSP